MTQEERLFILLLLAKRKEREEKEIQEILTQKILWKKFEFLCLINKSSSLIFLSLERYQSLIPKSLWETLEKEFLLVKEENKKRQERFKVLLEEAKKEEIPVIVLKGNALGPLVYKSCFYKKMNDVDILIKVEDRFKFLEILKKQGFFYAGEVLGKNPEKENPETSHHFPPFFSQDLSCMVGVHWGLVRPEQGFFLNYQEIWKRAVPFIFEGVSCLTLSWEDHLLHLCLHLSPYKCGGKELCDLLNIVRLSHFDWNLFSFLVGTSRAEKKVIESLLLCQSLLQEKNVSSFLEKIGQKFNLFSSFSFVVKKKSKNPSLLLSTRTAYFSSLDKLYGNFLLTKNCYEQWSFFKKIWKNLLFAPNQEARKIVLQGPIISQFLFPFILVKEFSKQLGMGTFFLLLLFLCFRMSKSFFLFFFFKVQGPDLSTYVQKLGFSKQEFLMFQQGLE